MQINVGTKEEYEFPKTDEINHSEHTAHGLLRVLVELDESLSDYQVTRLVHPFQSAIQILLGFGV